MKKSKGKILYDQYNLIGLDYLLLPIIFIFVTNSEDNFTFLRLHLT